MRYDRGVLGPRRGSAPVRLVRARARAVRRTGHVARAAAHPPAARSRLLTEARARRGPAAHTAIAQHPAPHVRHRILRT